MTSTCSHSIEFYGFSGKMGSGKDFLANKLKEKLDFKPWCHLAIADTFKIEGVAKNDLDFEKVFVKKDENTRIILQQLGTEKGRMIYGEDIWLKHTFVWIKLHISRGIIRFFLTDIRFPNELEWFKTIEKRLKEWDDKINATVTTIRVEAPQRNLQRVRSETDDPEKISHSSETSLDNCHDQFNYVIYNDFNDDGIGQIEDVVSKTT